MTKFIPQQATYDCVLACLAMATGQDYLTLWSEEFRNQIEHDKGTTKNGNHDKAFEIAGLQRDIDYKSIWCGQFSPNLIRMLLWKRRAFIQVPSLNHKGEQHYVYWDGEQLHDPSTKNRYQWLEHLCPEFVVMLT